ncbi:PQ_loop repeat-containing protein [Hexamita inflata]|uniref:PQ loop repeat-containing protein n=1 Tax=Hexamita inflata TaxID=28002 RepID=A0AA86P219_9EUKA|nr:PQ loop repeat-containing protein [Hexamita inflata]CAI9931162.1 PQ loop repeat-containing protein [Hexamita inflata]
MIKDPCCHEINTCDTNPYDYIKHLDSVDTTTLIIGFLILVGTVVSIIPMNLKLLTTKKVEGIAFTMLILVMYNQWSTIVNYIMAEFSKIMACTNSGKKCWSNMISLYQAIAQFIFYFILINQYLYYEVKELGKTKDVKRHLILYLVFIGFLILTIPSFTVPGFYYGPCNATYTAFALVFSIIAAVSDCIAWIPQIYATYKLKAVGSFSISAMLMQCPGCAITLIVAIMSGNPWYTWITWIVGFILQFILCWLLVKYYFQAKKSDKQKHLNQQNQDLIEEQTRKEVQIAQDNNIEDSK